MKRVRGLALAVVAVGSSVVLTACSSHGRDDIPRLTNAADVVHKVYNAHFPYVLGGGGPHGATRGAGGTEPGFDSAGLLSFAFADCCSMKIGDSVQQIYDNTRPLEAKGDKPLEVVTGELVFSKDKSVVGIIDQPGDKGSLEESYIIYADKKSGEIVREKFDKKVFAPEVRTINRDDIQRMMRDYSNWKDTQKEDSKARNSERFVDPAEGGVPADVDDMTKRSK